MLADQSYPFWMSCTYKIYIRICVHLNDKVEFYSGTENRLNM